MNPTTFKQHITNDTSPRTSSVMLYLPFVGLFILAEVIVIGTMSNPSTTGDPVVLWQWMLLFFLLFGATTTFTNSPREFFGGGKEFSQTTNKTFETHANGTFWTLALSSFITWVFAKSVYNASTLGAEFGWVGGLAYAMYYISFGSTAIVLYYHRIAGFPSLPIMIHTKYGKTAIFSYLLAVAYRLENEIWSNSIVVAGFYGPAGSSQYAAALIIGTVIPLVYVLAGGMRMSLYTDVAQAVVALIFLFILLGILDTISDGTTLFSYNPNPAVSNMWSLQGGFDLVIIAFLQGGFSYPFFDPTLTDRAFLCPPRAMFWALILGGTIAAAYVFAFAFLGIYGQMKGVGGKPQDVAAFISPSFFQFTALIMITSSLSTLDSAFVSTGKALGFDLPTVLRVGTPIHVNSATTRDVTYARIAILFMLLVGLLPCIADPVVLNATTMSGTVVMGLSGPVIGGLFVGPGTPRMNYRLPVAFHGSFWCGVVFGICVQAGVAPESFFIGTGTYALLLGYNLYGLLICWAFYLFGLFLHAFVLPQDIVKDWHGKARRESEGDDDDTVLPPVNNVPVAETATAAGEGNGHVLMGQVDVIGGGAKDAVQVV